MFSLKHAAQCRDLRDISRQRRQLVGERSRTRNRVNKVVGCSGLRLGGILTDVFGVNGRKVLKGVLEARPREFILESLTPHVRHKYDLFADALQAQLSEDMRFTLERLLQHHDHLNQMIVRFTRRLSKRLQPYSDQLELLCTIPGICPDSAMTLLVEIGPEIQVFANARSFAVWSGTAPGSNESGGKRRNARIRHGNRHLTVNLIECAHAAARTKDCQFQAYHKALTVRRGYRRATVATAHKLARTIYAGLRDRRPYRDPAVNYEELVMRRNAPRWFRQLTKFNILQRHPDGSVTLNWDC